MGIIMTEKVALQWNDFQSNAVSKFGRLRKSSEFKDATLVGEDHIVISAHKIILSSGSEYFRSILKQHDHSNPLICLDGVNSQDIENVLDFVYTGVLHLFHEDLDGFLQIAQKLKLEGLIRNWEEQEHSFLKSEEPLIEEEKVEGHAKELFPNSHEINEKIISFNSDEIPSTEDLDLKLKENVQKVNDGHKCIICEKVFKHSGHAREHIEMLHIEGLQLNCNLCDKIYRS